MGVLAELGRLAIGSWSPGGSGAGYIATGTYAGQIDSAYTSSAQLEILSVDIQRSKLVPTAVLPTIDKFSSLHWGNPSRAHPAGLIAGGFADGTVSVWDAASLLRTAKPTDDKACLVFSSASDDAANPHTASVRGIAFNPFIHTMLASGAADGQVLVWDLTNPSAGVTPRNPASKAPSASAADKEPVTALSWNRKVHNILGTASSTGVMNVYDLKQNRQVISIRHPRGRLACSSLAWHPDVATQIVITHDADDAAGALLWDLRNATSPVMTFSHHAPRGVSSASWCTHDTDLLLTSSKDSRTAVISVSSGEVVVDSPQTADWNFDVKWSPRVPGLYLASSFEGRLSVNSLLTASSGPSVSSETANALAESFGAMADDFQSSAPTQSPRATETQRVLYSVSRPPKWLARPSSISFAFGGRTASFSKGIPSVTVDSVTEDVPSLAKAIVDLDTILLDMTSDDPSAAVKWCKEQSELAVTRKDTAAWDVLAMLFETDSRRMLLQYLGFSPPGKDAGDEIAAPVCGLLHSQPIAVPVRPFVPSTDDANGISDDTLLDKSVSNGAPAVMLDGPAPWDVSDSALGDDAAMGSVLDGDDANGEESIIPTTGKAVSDATDVNGQELSRKSAEEVDDIIKHAVIVADFRAAVDACLFAGRTADALVIAYAGGPDLWSHTQAEYLSKASLSSGSSIVGAVVGPQAKMDVYLRHGAETGSDSWKEVLAMLLTYCTAEELSESCTSLGNRLLENNNDVGALTCFLCATNIRMVVSTWSQIDPEKGTSTAVMMKKRYDRLSNTVQKVRVTTAAVLLAQGEREIGTVRAVDEVSGSILCEFGALLSLHGDYSLAITYLSNLDGASSCMYGNAEDLHAQAADSLTSADANEISSSHYASSGFPATTHMGVGAPPMQPPSPFNGYGNLPTPPAAQSSGVGYNQMAYSPAPPVAPPVAPPIVPPPSANYGQQVMPAVSASAPPRPPMPSASMPYQNQATPATQVSATPVQMGMGVSPPPPPPMMPSYGTSPVGVGSGGPNMNQASAMYGMQSAPVVLGGAGAAQSMLPPPPPPPIDGGAPPPSSYHARARQGIGASLPPSAEVAVSETRRVKAASSSGTPGVPRRTPSTSSSLSALATDNVYLDKADFSKMGGKEVAIAKSLQKALAHARSLNQGGMYRRKMEDINKRLGRLVAGLSAGVVEKEVVEFLVLVVTSVEKGDRAQANSTVALLSKQFWDSNRHWIQGLKWLIDCVMSGR